MSCCTASYNKKYPADILTSIWSVACWLKFNVNLAGWFDIYLMKSTSFLHGINLHCLFSCTTAMHWWYTALLLLFTWSLSPRSIWPSSLLLCREMEQPYWWQWASEQGLLNPLLERSLCVHWWDRVKPLPGPATINPRFRNGLEPFVIC